jgi:hypothetical protein
MRTRTVLTLSLMLTLAAGGCAGKADDGGRVASAGGTPTPSSSAEARQQDEDAAIKFSQCMRDQGLTWFPDPQPNGGGISLAIPKGKDKEKVDKAMEACKKYAPGGGEKRRMSPEELEEARKMAQCMRDNGVKDFPDPQPDGSIRLDGRKMGMGPGDPTFDKAEKECSKYGPGGSAGKTQIRVGA